MVNVAEDDRIRIEKLELGPFGTNAYILTCRQTSASVLVDAPGEAGKIMSQLKGTDPKYILMTHNHMDHTGALADVKAALNVPIAAHRDDAGSLPLQPDMLLSDGDVVSWGDIQSTVLHTPGHTPGSLCFLTGNYLIAGDTLIFAEMCFGLRLSPNGHLVKIYVSEYLQFNEDMVRLKRPSICPRPWNIGMVEYWNVGF